MHTPCLSTASTQLRVDTDTDKTAWNAMWKSVWPRLLRRCGSLTRGNMDTANDLAAEVALCLCKQHGRGVLRCENLAALACRLAHLRLIGIWRTKSLRDKRLAALAIHIDIRNGRKVVASHTLMYDEEKNDEIE